MSRRYFVILTFGCAIAACRAVRPTELGAPDPTADDIRTAMRDSVSGWMFFRSDGTVRGDSARRIASLAAWDLEGGDPYRALRLLRSALRLGVNDSLFYQVVPGMLTPLRQSDLALSVCTEAIVRWPRAPWSWQCRADALRWLGRNSESAAAQDSARRLAPPRSSTPPPSREP